MSIGNEQHKKCWTSRVWTPDDPDFFIQYCYYTFALLGGAAASITSSTFLPKGRHLPLQPLQTLPQGSEVRLTATRT